MKFKLSDLKLDTKFNKPLFEADTDSMILGPWIGVDATLINYLKKAKITELETAGESLAVSGAELKEKIDSRVETAVAEEGDYLKYKQYSDDKEKLQVFHDEMVKVMAEVFNKVKKENSIDLSLIKNAAFEFVELGKTSAANSLFTVMLLKSDLNYLCSAAVNVAFYSLALGKALKLPDDGLVELVMGALTHDIGMLKIPDTILYKQGPLNDTEYRLIKTAPIHSYQILNKHKFPLEVLNIAIQHHEQFDGMGYPKKLKGEQISLYARIVAITDNFVAQKSKRMYREEKSSYYTMRTILSETQHKFDPNILKTFLSIMAIYPIGSLVRLNSGFISLVLKANPKSPIRPVLKLIADKNNNILADKKVVHLRDRKDLYIMESYNEKELGIDLYTEAYSS